MLLLHAGPRQIVVGLAALVEWNEQRGALVAKAQINLGLLDLVHPSGQPCGMQRRPEDTDEGRASSEPTGPNGRKREGRGTKEHHTEQSDNHGDDPDQHKSTGLRSEGTVQRRDGHALRRERREKARPVSFFFLFFFFSCKREREREREKALSVWPSGAEAQCWARVPLCSWQSLSSLGRRVGVRL
jgi:hypothetical protein